MKFLLFLFFLPSALIILKIMVNECRGKQRLQDINYRTLKSYVSNRQWGNVEKIIQF